MCRGIERRKVFETDSDREHILGRLGEILQETQTICYACRDIRDVLKYFNIGGMRKEQPLMDRVRMVAMTLEEYVRLLAKLRTDKGGPSLM